MSNSLDMELEGKWVLIKQDLLKPEFHPERFRLVQVTGGFGASPYTSGSALMVVWHVDGEKSRLGGHDVERLVEGEELARLQALNDSLREPPDMTVTVQGSDGTLVGTLKLGDEYDENEEPEERAKRAAAVAWNFLAKNAIYKVDGHSFTASDCAEWWA